MKPAITSFRGENFFLSNMYPCIIVLGNVRYTCAEAAFQAVKLADKAKRKQFEGLSGTEAKQLGRRVPLRSDWNKIRVDVMKWILTEKFRQNPELLRKLKQTGNCELVEGNTWGDTFWGICKGVGKNNLGTLLMELRDSL